MTEGNERLRILEMIDSGTISASDGIRLLQALGPTEDEAVEAPSQAALETEPSGELRTTELPLEAAEPAERLETAQEFQEATVEEPELDSTPKSQPAGIPQHLDRWRRWWYIPLWIGVGITVLGGLLMFLAYQKGGLGFWFACTWFPFLLGVAVLGLAWASRSARWIHVRVHQKPGEKPQKIAISFPVPLRLTGWSLRTFGRFIPQLEGTSLDEVIMALEKTSPESPFYVEVDEGEDGERVEVYIG